MSWYFDYYFGADFGQANDYTALAIVEEPVWIPGRLEVDPTALHPIGREGWVSPADLVPAQVQHFRGVNYYQGRPPHPPLSLRHLERMRHQSYGKIVDRIAELMASPSLATAAVCLVVDHTGVGRGVMDWLKAAGLSPLGVTITGGNEVHYDPENNLVTCPKRDLVVATQAALQNGRLRIAADLEHAETLTSELKNYRVKISAAGHDSYDAREGQHDDLVLGTALAVWWRDWLNAPMEAAHAAAQRPRAS
jgi:hypothetical protein